MISPYMPTVSARVEVLPDSASARARFSRLVSEVPSALPGSTPQGSIGLGDESAYFTSYAGTAVTLQGFVRVANSVHFIGLVGDLNIGVVADQAKMTTEYFGYFLVAQLAHLTGTAAIPLTIPTPAEPRHPPGYTAAYPNGWHVSVLGLAEQAPTDSIQPSIGNRFITATVMATNGAPSGAEDLAAVDFQLIGKSRVPRGASSLGAALPDGLVLRSVAPGKSVTATVTFEVQLAESGFTIVYKAGHTRAPGGYPGVAWIGN